MNSIQDITKIATTELHTYLEQQVSAIAPEPIKVYTPQRRARYHDKTRIRFVNIKALALRDCKCSDTAEMKRRLKILGINLDLRLTAAWIAIAWELQDRILAILPLKPAVLSNEELLLLAVSQGALARFEEYEEGSLYWIWKTPQEERELVTSSGLPMYLRQLE